MATMPKLGERRVPASGRRIASVDLSAEGRAMEQFGNTGVRIAEDQIRARQQEDDAQAVFHARRQLDDWERATLHDPQNGAVAKLGRDAFDLPKSVPESFDKFAGKLGEGVGSPRARNAIQEMVASRRDQAARFVDRHAFQQKQVFEEGQLNADVDSGLNRAALLADAGDLATARAETQLVQTRVTGFMKSRGKSEEEIATKVREIGSKAAITTINVLLEKDKPMEAEAYLKANASGMRVEDMLRAQSVVSKAVDARQALVVAQDVVATVLKPAIEPTDFGRLANLAGVDMPKLTGAVMQAESGGKRYAKDGQLLTSPKGAQGEMQVMPGTAKSPGYGVAPAKDGSPDELARVGRDYLGAMVKEFKGDLRMALAAYNAGPGAVQDAVKSHGENWLAKMPAETQGYVAKITKAYGDGGGAPAMPTLASLHDQVRAKIPPDQPQRRKLALDAVTQQYETELKAKKQGEDEATAEAMRWLSSNGGRFSEMPAGLRANVPPKEVDNLMTYGQKVAKGDDITNPVVFQRLATDDKFLKGMSDAEFYRVSQQLSQADQQQMALRRGNLLNKEQPAGQKPDNLDTTAVNSILNNRLQQIGVDPTPKDGAPAMRVGAIRKFVWDSVLQAQLASGKRFSDAEMTSTIDKLFATNVTFQTSFLGINTGSESQRLLGMQAGDIPGDVRKRLKDDFKANGISDPTDADILGAYFRLRAARQ